MRIKSEVYKKREVYGRTWEMQISFIKGNGYQATYYYGAEDKIWSKCFDTPEAAAYDLDKIVDFHFGKEPVHYVKINDRIDVPINGLYEAERFAKMFDGVIQN